MTEALRYFGELAVNAGEMGRACRNSFLARVKKTDIVHPSVFVNSRSPFSALAIETHPNKTGRVVSLPRLVAAIIGICGKPQIRHSVIRSRAIDVVDLVEWPIAAHMTPRNMVGVIVERFRIRNLDLKVTLHTGPGDSTSIPAVPFARLRSLIAPSQKSSLWIVIKKRTNEFCTQRWSAFCRHLRTYRERLLDRRRYVNLTLQHLAIGG